jgi:hypothetical protein
VIGERTENGTDAKPSGSGKHSLSGLLTQTEWTRAGRVVLKRAARLGEAEILAFKSCPSLRLLASLLYLRLQPVSILSFISLSARGSAPTLSCR